MAWMAALTHFELSRVYPFVALSFVLVLLLSAIVFGESLTWPKVVDLARGARGEDSDGYRADFIRLAELAGDISFKLAAATPMPRHE